MMSFRQEKARLEGRPDNRSPRIILCVTSIAAVFIWLAGIASAQTEEKRRTKPQLPPFMYVGGTEDVGAGCRGDLQLSEESLVFKCSQHVVEIPYQSIKSMLYRPDVPRKVRSMRVEWRTVPPPGHRNGKENRYFTVMFEQGQTTRVLVLRVRPLPMRPYLAEIDLKSGSHIEVSGYENYE